MIPDVLVLSLALFVYLSFNSSREEYRCQRDSPSLILGTVKSWRGKFQLVLRWERQIAFDRLRDALYSIMSLGSMGAEGVSAIKSLFLRYDKMIRALLYDLVKQELHSGGEELIPLWQGNPQALIWVDFSQHDDEHEKELMVNQFGLHPLGVQDAQRKRHPPKLESFKDHTFLLLKGLSDVAEDFQFSTIQLAVFIGPRFLVTRHWDASPSVEQMRKEITREPHHFADGLDALAIRLGRLVVNRYLNILLKLEPRLEELENAVINKPSDNILAELINLKTELKKFRRVFIYHQQIFSDLKHTACPEIRQDHIHEIIDVYEQQERAVSLAALYHELASDLVDGYISVASHRLNHIMKILTIVTTIFVPLSFLAGIYGMNFENMPELHSRSGYYILLGVMGTVILALLTLFRKFRWI